MLKRIHINQHIIRANLKNNEEKPCITVKTYKKNVYGSTVEILGPCRVVSSLKKPLSCGARIWIETEAEILIDGVPF